MAAPNSKDTLKDYCLRQLGFPVIEINVDDDQLDDRVDEAIQFWQTYHDDATEKFFLKHKVTNSELIFQAVTTGTFVVGEVITGGTSGAESTVQAVPSTSTLKSQQQCSHDLEIKEDGHVRSIIRQNLMACD